MTTAEAERNRHRLISARLLSAHQKSQYLLFLSAAAQGDMLVANAAKLGAL